MKNTRNGKAVNSSTMTNFNFKTPSHRLFSSSSLDQLYYAKDDNPLQIYPCSLSANKFIKLQLPKLFSTITSSRHLQPSLSVKNITYKFPTPKKRNRSVLKSQKENEIIKSVFPHKYNSFTHEKREIVNNKLNIFYAESESHYQMNLKRINKEKISKGKAILQDSIFLNKKMKLKMKNMKESIFFIKNVIDYSYPQLISIKNKLNSSIKPDALLKSTPIYKEQDKKIKETEHMLSKSLLSSLTVHKIKVLPIKI